MSQVSDEFEIGLSVAPAFRACCDAIASVGWNIETHGRHRIVAVIGPGLTRNPSSIEVTLGETESSRTSVKLDGIIGGLGPIQKRHLTGEVNKLRDAIEVATAKR